MTDLCVNLSECLYAVGHFRKEHLKDEEDELERINERQMLEN